MNHDFPVGETFPDEELAPVTAESVRYVLQLKRVNRVVVGLKEVDVSLAEKARAIVSVVAPLSEHLAEAIRALLEHTAALADNRAQEGERLARQEELIAAVRSLEARIPDKSQMCREIVNDLWVTYEGQVL